MGNISENDFGNNDLINRKDNKTDEAKSLDISKKGIKLFFGEAERKFLENAGKEISIDVLQESFILYRIDYKETRTHHLYGEAKRKVYLPPIEVFGRINLEATGPEYFTPGGLIRKGYGVFTAHIYISHLDEVGAKIRMGDFVYHKGNYYEITDDGSSYTDNKHAFGGDKFYYISIKAIEVNRDVFEAK